MRNARTRFIDEGTRAVWSLLEAAGGEERPATQGATVRFLDGPKSASMSVLEVEHGGSPDTLEDVREALFDLRIQVVRATVAPRGSSVEHLRVAEFDGARIGKRRQEEVRMTLMALLSAE